MTRSELGHVALCATLCAVLVACGDSDDSSSGTPVGKRDAGADAGPDAGRVEHDAGRPPDAGKDTGTPDEDAGHVPCSEASCEAEAGQCRVGTCNPTTRECEFSDKADNTLCGSGEDNLCTDQDRCMDGVCQANDAPIGTPCGDIDVACRQADTCDGQGQCTDNGFKTPGTACGSSATTACDAPDTCDALGACNPNYALVDTPCGDIGVECHHADTCNGLGQCLDSGLWSTNTVGNYSQCGALGGTAIGGVPYCKCGNQLINECTNVDVCVAGECVPNNLNEDAACGTVGVCETERKCESGACVPALKDDGTMCGTADNDCQINKECSAGACVPVNKADGAGCGNSTNAPPCNLADTCLAGICQTNVAQNGVSCGDPTSTRECDGADSCQDGACSPNNYGPIVCGPMVGECELPDLCSAGTCQPDPMAFLPPGAACGDTTSNDCHDADTCDGAGQCEPNTFPTGTLCGSQTSGECDARDTCDGSGSCQPNHVSAGAPCGDGIDNECNASDTCDDSGNCLDNLAEPGASCGLPATACAPQDVCDGLGACDDMGELSSCSQLVAGYVFADDTDLPLEGVEVFVYGNASASTVTDASGRFTVDAPVQVPIIVVVGESPGYWGTARVRTLAATDQELPNTYLIPDSELADLAASMPGAPSLIPGSAYVLATFSGESGAGGEGASIGATHVGPFTEDGSVFVESDDLITDDALHFFNVDASTAETTISAHGSGSGTCAVLEGRTSWPIFPHVLSRVPITCQ